MKQTLVLVAMAIVAVVVVPVNAAQDALPGSKAAAKLEKRQKAKPAKKEKFKVEPAEMVLSGNIARDEKVKTEGGKTSVKYVPTDTEGHKITLPKPKGQPRKKKDEKGSVINLDDYLHVGVKVYGRGTVVRKGGEETVKLSKIHRIEKGPGVTDIDIFSEN